MPNLFDRLVERDWELAATLIIVLVGLMIGARKLGDRPFVSMFPRITAIAELILGPLAVIALGSLIRVAARYLGAEQLDDDLRSLTVIATYGVGTLVVARAIDIIFLAPSRDEEPDRVPGLLRGLFYTGCFVVGLAIYLNAHGYSITGVWVSTGVVAALAGFALQRTLGDLFSGIALSIERPFRAGDWLELRDGSVGQVVDINWRATRLRAWDNATLVIPNGELAGQGFKNLHGPTHLYAPWYLIKVPSEIDPRMAKALLLEAALRCSNVLRDPLPVVRLNDASTVPYTYMVWVHFRNYPAMFAGREELFREVHYALKSAGIQIAPDIKEWHIRRATVSQAEPPNILLALKGLDVTHEWSDEELEQIAAASRYLTFDAGTVILPEGRVADAVDVVFTGVVQSSVVLTDGSEKPVEQLCPGEYFGITSMTTAEPSFLQFTAKTDVTVIRIDVDCLRLLVEGNPRRVDEVARIVKQRMDAAEQIRAASRRPAPSLSLIEVLRRVEQSLMGPKRP